MESCCFLTLDFERAWRVVADTSADREHTCHIVKVVSCIVLGELSADKARSADGAMPVAERRTSGMEGTRKVHWLNRGNSSGQR